MAAWTGTQLAGRADLGWDGWWGDEAHRTRPQRMDTQRPLPTWREMTLDTTPEAEAVLLRLWRETPGWRKWQMMEELNRLARELALAGLRRRHPDASPEVLRRRLADLLLGPELAAQVYGPGVDGDESDD